MAEKLQVYLLGEFRLYRDGVLVSPKDWHTRQARQLFKLLLTERGHAVSIKKLTSLLWPEHADNAYKTLRSAISILRSVLEPDRNPQTPSSFVPRGRAGYILTFPTNCTVWVDAIEFERLLDEALTAQTHNTPEQRALLETALQLYSGDYLAEDDDASWTVAKRQYLCERYFAGSIKLAEWQYEAGLYSEAITICRKALNFDHYREPLYRLIMQCQAHQGDTVAALQTFERCRQLLDEYLGADPSPQTLKLHTMVLQGTFRANTPFTIHRDASYGYPVHDELPVVGRKRELDWFTQQLREIQTQLPQNTRTIAIVGEAGIGKSFLVRLFFNYTRFEGIRVITANCQAIEQDVSFAPLVSMLGSWLLEMPDHALQALPHSSLAQIASLIPELAARLPGLSLPTYPNSEQAYSLLIAGLVDLFATLAQRQPLLLAWDDLQWADASTLLVINRLACLERVSLLLLISYRPEDLSENKPLDHMLRYLRRREHTSILNLARFSPEEVAEYLALHATTLPLSAERLYQTTQGNALFLAEAVRILLEQKSQPTQAVDPSHCIHTILQSQQIRDVILARIERLSPCAIDLLKIAAVIGHPFSLDLLQPQLSSDEDAALDLLLTRRFLVEVTPVKDFEVYLAFSHEMVGQIVYATCSTFQLTRLHRQVAENMVRRYAPNTEIHAAEIAFHYRRSGPSFEAQVLRYEVEAGDYARRTFSYSQALTHYDAAMQILKHVSPLQLPDHALGINEWAGRVYYGRGLTCEALLDWEGVQESYRYLSLWATTNKKLILACNSTSRMAGIRSLMGHLSEAAYMGISVIQHLQADADTLNDVQDRTQKSLRTMIDMTQRWTSLITVDPPCSLHEPNLYDEISSEPFAPYYPAPLPAVSDWHEMIEILGAPQAALTLAEHGWVLLLQGFNADAEQCLKAALQAAEETDQVTYWILSAMHLSRVYHLYGQEEQGLWWFERCLERSQQVPEATWAMMWPLLNHAYHLVSLSQLDEAEHILQTLQAHIAQQRDFLAHRYSVQIGFGLIALARGEIQHAETLLQDALAHQPCLYIESYILAELGTAHIARQKGHLKEAVGRFRMILAFCGQRSLLQYYSATALALARLLLHMGQTQRIPLFLEHVSHLVTKAQYAEIYQQLCKLQARMTVTSE